MDPVVNTGVPAAPPAAPTAPAVTAPPAEGSVAPSPGASPVIDWKTAPEQLRTQYETTKAERERLAAEKEKWEKLGNFDEVSQIHGTFSQKMAQAVEMGKALGYTAEQIREYFYDDPKGTLAALQQAMSQPVSMTREQQAKELEKLVDERTRPIKDQFEQTINAEASRLYETERDRLFKSEFADGLPEENKEELFEILDTLIANDQAALSRLKFQHQTSDIARHMTAAKATFLKRHHSYIAHERGKSAPKVPNGKPPRDEQTGKYADRKLSIGGTVAELLGGR